MLAQEVSRIPLRRVACSPKGKHNGRQQIRKFYSQEEIKNIFISEFPPECSPGFPPKGTILSSGWKLGTKHCIGAKPLRFVVKDNIATTNHGSPTTCASKILHSYKSPFAAHVVERLSQVSENLGKTNLDEFGMGSHNQNSYYGPLSDHQGYSIGGSSGGSAIAVALRKATIGLGTDTGGSVRLPAAYTGTCGFKPSYGMISRWGVIPYANSLDTVGVIAPSARHVKSAFNIVQGYDERDPTSLMPSTRLRIQKQQELAEEKRRLSNTNPSIERIEPNNEQRPCTETETKESSTSHEHEQTWRLRLDGIKIGVPLEYNIAEMSPQMRRIWQMALIAMQRIGADIVPISLPNTKHALSAYYVLAPAEAASNLSKYDGVRYGYREEVQSNASENVLYSHTRGQGFGQEVKRRILLGSYTLSSDAIDNYFIKAQKVRRLVQRDFDRVFRTPNPLRPVEQFDLSDMDESVLLENKLGPPQVDFIVAPTAPTRAPKIEDVKAETSAALYVNDVFTVPASLAGIPAISIPWQTSTPKGFTGIQIMGQFGDDFQLLDFAKNFEQHLQTIQKEKARNLASTQEDDRSES